MKTNYCMSFHYQVIRSFLEFNFSPLCASEVPFQNVCSLSVIQSRSEQNSGTGGGPQGLLRGMSSSGGKILSQCCQATAQNLLVQKVDVCVWHFMERGEFCFAGVPWTNWHTVNLPCVVIETVLCCLDDLQRSLSSPIILWFSEKVYLVSLPVYFWLNWLWNYGSKTEINWDI